MDEIDRGHEFTCAECGRTLLRTGPPPKLKLCLLCVTQPGWHQDVVEPATDSLAVNRLLPRRR